MLVIPLLPRYGMPFEYIKKVGREQRQLFIQQVADIPFLIALHLSG